MSYYDESFLDWWEEQLMLLKRRSDGIWEREPVLDVKKRDEKIRPVGTVEEVFKPRTKVGIMDVEKSVYSDEQQKILERIERLEKLLLPYENRAFDKIKYGGAFDIGQPKQRVTVQEQPKVQHQTFEKVVAETVKSILRGEYAQRGYDGTPYQCLNAELMLAKTLQKLKKGVR